MMIGCCRRQLGLNTESTWILLGFTGTTGSTVTAIVTRKSTIGRRMHCTSTVDGVVVTTGTATIVVGAAAATVTGCDSTTSDGVGRDQVLMVAVVADSTGTGTTAAVATAVQLLVTFTTHSEHFLGRQRKRARNRKK